MPGPDIPAAAQARAVLWVDVADPLRTRTGSVQAGEQQTVAAEILLALAQGHGANGAVRFVRRGGDGLCLVPVGAAEVLAAYAPGAGMGGGAATIGREPRADAPAATPRRLGRLVRSLTDRLPVSFQRALLRYLLLQYAALRALPQSGAAWLRAARAVPRRRRDPMPAPQNNVEAATQPGDVLVLLGASDWDPRTAPMLRRLRTEQGMTIRLLAPDLAPLLRPDWFDRGICDACRTWLKDVLPLCDVILAGSRATIADLERHACSEGIAMPSRPRLLPIGSARTAPAAAETGHAMPQGAYVLCVSPLAAWTNHGMLLRAWRRLIDTRPPDAVPTLVLAGRIGSLVEDVLRQLRNADFLGGKIRLIADPRPGDPAELYRRCLFTICASQRAGAALPVTESLAHGKPCLSAGTPWLREAGGDLARYFDPEGLADCCAAICETLDDPAGLAAWHGRIAAGFRRVSWQETADAIVAGSG